MNKLLVEENKQLKGKLFEVATTTSLLKSKVDNLLVSSTAYPNLHAVATTDGTTVDATTDCTAGATVADGSVDVAMTHGTAGATTGATAGVATTAKSNAFELMMSAKRQRHEEFPLRELPMFPVNSIQQIICIWYSYGYKVTETGVVTPEIRIDVADKGRRYMSNKVGNIKRIINLLEENNIVDNSTLSSFIYLRPIRDEVEFRTAYTKNNATAIIVYDKFQSKINELDKKHKSKNAFTLDAVIKRITRIEANSLNKENQMDEDDEDDEDTDGTENDQDADAKRSDIFDSEL